MAEMSSPDWDMLVGGSGSQSTSPLRATRHPTRSPPRTEESIVTPETNKTHPSGSAGASLRSSCLIFPGGLLLPREDDSSRLSDGASHVSHCKRAYSNGASADDLPEHGLVNRTYGGGNGAARSRMSEKMQCLVPTSTNVVICHNDHQDLSDTESCDGSLRWVRAADPSAFTPTPHDSPATTTCARVLPNPHIAAPVSVVCLPARLLQRQSPGTKLCGAAAVEGGGRTSPLDPPDSPFSSACDVMAHAGKAAKDGEERRGTRKGDEVVSAATHPPATTAEETEVADICLGGTHQAAGDGKDHLTPVRGAACRVRRCSGVFCSSHNTSNTSSDVKRRPSFSSLPTPALSPPSAIPPMTLYPQSVIDHFHDAYRGKAAATTATTTPLPHYKEGGSCAVYPPNTATTRFEEPSTHPMPPLDLPAQYTTSSKEGKEDGSDADNPPLLSATQRHGEHVPTAAGGEADPASGFFYFFPAETASAAETRTPSRRVHGGASASSLLAPLPREGSGREAPVFEAGSWRGDGHLSPPEVSVAIALRCPSPPRVAMPATERTAPRDPPQRWFAEAAVDDADGLTEAAAAHLAVAVTCSSSSHSPTGTSPLKDVGNLLPTSPPLGAITTPPECSSDSDCRPSSLPRRPPRARFSTRTSTQQLSLVDPVAGAVTSAALPAVGAERTHTAPPPPPPLSPCSAAATRSEEGGWEREGDGRTSSPASLPTSPGDADLAALVQRHASECDAQPYAQSCSYYLHYHAKPALLLGGPMDRSAASYPSSPEDYQWEDGEMSDEDDVSAPKAVQTPLYVQTLHVATVGDKVDVACGTTTTAAATGATTACADPCPQQPLRRRFSCAVPRMGAL